MTSLTEIEGIGKGYAARLEDCGIFSMKALLAAGADPQGRKSLTTESGINPKLIFKWVSQADLARVRGIGSEYAELLEAAGVDTVPELAARSATNLHRKLATVNEKLKLVRALPAQDTVADWIVQAKRMPQVIEF